MLVEIAMTTWPSSEERVKYFVKCIEALRNNLVCFDPYVMIWSVNCETEVLPGQQHCSKIVDDWCHDNKVIHRRRDGKADLGSNMNNILRNSNADYVFLVQDDRLLTRSLNLNFGLGLLEEYKKIASINYAMSNNANFYTSSYGRVHEFYLLSPNTPRLYINPQSLISSSFVKRFGYFTEGGLHGKAELDMDNCIRSKKATTLLSSVHYFEHCGIKRANGKEL